MKSLLVLLFLLMSSNAQGCEYPEEGTMPLRRTVSRVRSLPDTAAWASEMHKAGSAVQYIVLLQKTVRVRGRCYWTVEAVAEGKPWRRFYVSPDGKRVLAAGRRKEAAARQAATP